MCHICTILFSILNGGFGAAAVMISVGGVLGKLNPFQILVMSVIEAAMFVLSCFIGYDILGVVDVGKRSIQLIAILLSYQNIP